MRHEILQWEKKAENKKKKNKKKKKKKLLLDKESRGQRGNCRMRGNRHGAGFGSLLSWAAGTGR